MPWMMIAFRPLEFVVQPDVTYIIIADYDPLRRIFTDGRDFPNESGADLCRAIRSANGSTTDGDGKYDVLEVETRNFKGPRIYDASGLPLHRDNQICLQGADLPRQERSEHPSRRDHSDRQCPDAALDRRQEIHPQCQSARGMARNRFASRCNSQVFIGKELYYMSADGHLMPTRKGQPPPDTRYFDKK